MMSSLSVKPLFFCHIQNTLLEEAGMAQLDDNVGALLKAVDDMGEADIRSSSLRLTTVRKCSLGRTAA